MLKVGGSLLGLVVIGLVIGFLALRGDGAPPPASETNDPTPTPTDVRAQVEQAYLHAWDVWADALLELDPSGLDEAMTGPALELVTDQVEAQAEINQPVRIRAEHNYRIVMINGTTASVDDQYVNHSVRLDPDTLEPIEDDPRFEEHRSFTMRLVDGTWKLARIIEYDDS